MHSETTNPWLHRLAWLTAIVALLPISVGAVVTTVDAGMAFADWPTSHGQGMLAFPWWQSQGDEFLEHGHRLAGMLTGLVSLLLTAVAFFTPAKSSERAVVTGILAGVIVQGLLGGWRVLADERVIAMLHAIFAAIVFSLMAVLVAMTSRSWAKMDAIAPQRSGSRIVAVGVSFLLILSTQYLLGGLLRHLAWSQAWLLHPWFAIAVVAGAVVFTVVLQRSGSASLRRAGWWVAGLVLLQASIGLLTWGVRYGFPQWGIVAVQQSSLQIAVRSVHKVAGLLTFMATVVALARVWQLRPSLPKTSHAGLGTSVSTVGGVA